MSAIIRMIKDTVLKNVSLLPNRIAFPLMQLNLSPRFIFGNAYQNYRSFLDKYKREYDNHHKLLDIVRFAIHLTPFYQKRYQGIDIRTIDNFEKSVGFIDKDIVLKDYDEFINPAIASKDYDVGTTGGTSGKPLIFIAPKNRYVVELATMHTLWSRAGWNLDPRAVIRNHKLKKGKDFIVNPITREVIFDGFQLEADYFELVFRTIKKLNLRFIHCYPSTAYEFSTFLLDRGCDTSFIRAFLSGSENIFDYQMDLIQNRLGIRFYNWYGHSEKLILAGYCEHTNLYHVEPTYGYFELIDENNRPIREPGKVGEMVGTGFHNPGMVLIRYRTGDFAEYAGDYCPSCKRHVTLLKNIWGRWSGDKLYNADGTFLTTTALNLHSELYSVINGMQYVQDTMGIVRILIIKSPAYEAGHEAALYRHFREKFKTGTEILIEYVDKLQKLPNGKFLHIISTVKV